MLEAKAETLEDDAEDLGHEGAAEDMRRRAIKLQENAEALEEKAEASKKAAVSMHDAARALEL